jgi:hypothetical protein
MSTSWLVPASFAARKWLILKMEQVLTINSALVYRGARLMQPAG